MLENILSTTKVSVLGDMWGMFGISRLILVLQQQRVTTLIIILITAKGSINRYAIVIIRR